MAGEPLGEIVDIGLADGCLRTENSNHAARCPFRGGLDRGDCPDHRQVKRSANLVQRDRARGVAGDHHQPGLIAFDKAAEQGGHSRRDLGFRLGSVRIAGAIRRIDDRRSRQQLPSRSEDGQAADSRIEKQQWRARVHANRI